MPPSPDTRPAVAATPECPSPTAPSRAELTPEEQARWDLSWEGSGPVPRRYMVYNWLIYYWMREVLPEFRNLGYIELGGGGELLAILSREVSSVTALDRSTSALNRCRAILKGRTNARFVEADLFDHRPETPEDVSMSFGVIEHFDPDRMLESVKAHARCARKYVVIGVPSDVPHNWWRAARNMVTGEFPPWKPMDVREMWPLFEEAGIEPFAATRLDPTCGRKGPFWRLYRAAIKSGLLRRWALDHRNGGLALLAGKVTDKV